MKKTTKKTDIVEMARQARLRAEEDAKAFAELEKRAKLARGTRDVKPSGNVIVKPARGPYWVGDEGPTDELKTMIWRMLLDRPYRFREIVEATGAGENRIKGAIMALQREGKRVVNIGDPAKALWFAPTDEVLKRILSAKKVATARRG